METMDELSTTCNSIAMSRCLSVPDATSLHHCLKNKELKLMLSVVRIQVFSIIYISGGCDNTCIHEPAAKKRCGVSLFPTTPPGRVGQHDVYSSE